MINDVPAVLYAVNEPVEEPIVTILTLLLLHVPPLVPSARLLVPPSQIPVAPVITDIGLTVTVVAVLQPPGPV